MKRTSAVVAAISLLLFATPSASTQSGGGATPVVFVHGMGSSAAEIGTTQFAELLQTIAERHPAPDACARDVQPDRPWEGSPCVFRYVEDAAETDDGPNDSQSSVAENAEKLGDELIQMQRNGSAPVILVGYSMGGAIIRTFLATDERAAKLVEAVVLVDAVASGSWGYAFAQELPRRVDGSLGAKLEELMRSMAASSASVDFARPATRDLSPRSAHFRRITRTAPPPNVSYYTFWGDIRIVIQRGLLHYELPDYELPSVGDLGLLPGDPDPSALPELGGQRFSPDVEDGQVALDIAHEARISLDASVIRDLIRACGQKPSEEASAEGAGAKDAPDCGALVAEHFTIPNTHTAIPNTMGDVGVDVPELGGEMTLLEAMLEAIARHA